MLLTDKESAARSCPFPMKRDIPGLLLEPVFSLEQYSMVSPFAAPVSIPHANHQPATRKGSISFNFMATAT